MRALAIAAILTVGVSSSVRPAATSQPTKLSAGSVTIQIPALSTQPVGKPQPRLTACFTRDDLRSLLTERVDLLGLPFQFKAQQKTFLTALEKVSMAALVEKLGPFLTEKFPQGFDPARDLIIMPVPVDKQVELKAADLPEGRYQGPREEITGFLLRNISEQEYIEVAIHVMHTARQMLYSGNPAFDRTSPHYFKLLAERELAQRLELKHQAEAEAKAKEQIKQTIGKALGIYDPATGKYAGTPNWTKESRRFAYVVTEGQFIERLRPVVEKINKDLETAGFPGPSGTDRPGIYFDKDLQEVDIVLPEAMMKTFLDEADRLERRLAEDHMISIEAVRLTDREIIDGALASQLNVSSQGVHQVNRLDKQWLRTQVGVNSLLAVANGAIQVATLRGVQDGFLPEGTTPIALAPVDVPLPPVDRTVTNLGGRFAVGADSFFIEGRDTQSYGFSYIGPDGLEHRLSLDVVDSLRELWNRIERNLIVHKIKKIDKPVKFTVPVGPETKTFEGIAALISQENRDLVITSEEGSLVRLSATAGTWLIIQDFEIHPTPGSSMVLTAPERQTIEDRVLFTMFLRDPMIDVETKTRMVETASRQELGKLLSTLYAERAERSVRPDRTADTYKTVYEKRLRETISDASIEKKEKNSKITLTFFSSQGNIVQQAGPASLGDANDLTSFTTELRPNRVTPISSFFTKTASGAKGTSPLTGLSKGEQTAEEKTMAHLVVRVRFPTLERERHDREEGRYLGYFDLPMGKIPHSTVDLPFLSSSEHPLNRLAKLRVGLMFESLQPDRVRKPLDWIDPNSLGGTVPADVWETATTRLMMNRKIISDSPAAEQSLAARYRERFKIEVRSLLEYDEDFFEAPNIALRNMAHWNNPERIVLALNNSAGKFALQRIVLLIDELGEKLVPDDYASNFLARSRRSVFGRHKIHPLSERDLKDLRRDVANHYMRFNEAYGDAFLEAISIMMGLGTYRGTNHKRLLAAPFRGYRDFVVFDTAAGALTEPELHREAHEQFKTLLRGGYKGGLFQPSFEYIEDLSKPHRKFVIRGRDILAQRSQY